MSTTEAITCQELVELVTDYFEGALSPSDEVRFEDHLVMCGHCVTYVEQMRATVELLGRLAEDQLPPTARDELLAAFRTWKRRGR